MSDTTTLSESSPSREYQPKRLDEPAVRASYRRYAWAYDSTFGLALAPGRRQAIRHMRPQKGERILEIGIGTGLSIDLYPKSVALTGVDLSTEMLSRAARRVARAGRRNVHLHQMDAKHLAFPDNCFDRSIAMYVASVTPTPVAMMREMKRVTRPGGALYVLNHFSRRGSPMTTVERLLSPFAAVLGFEPLFYLDEFLERTGLEPPRIHPVQPLGYWLLLAWRNPK